MVSNIQIYESLRGTIGEEAATILAEAIPQASDLATKSDLRAEVDSLRAEMKLGFAELKTELKGVESSLMRWMLTFFVPLWLGVWAVVLGLILAK